VACVTDALALATIVVPCAGGLLIQLARTARAADRINTLAAAATAAVALTLAAVALAHPDAPRHGDWYVLDGASGAFLAVIAVIGMLSAVASPAYLADHPHGLFAAERSHRWYYLGFYVFWAALLALPLIDNLGGAWLVVEATTGASALLVAYTGASSALEAGWKYLVLTTFGLTVALFGILVLYVGLAPHGGTLATLDWRHIAHASRSLSPSIALLAFLLIIGGLASKAGWAPVHNWLPDAHSEAPPPVSALLSAALLPTVTLVAWRVLATVGPAIHRGSATAVFIAFGLASLAISVPFLWRAQPWKRLLAYSSLEHMGVIALGIGFATPLATAGVLLHLAGHALAKSLGFYTAIPLATFQPDAGEQPPRGLARASVGTAAGMGVALATLAGLPPSPLFLSELLILLGGIAAGQLAIVVIAAALLSLGFLGLAHALIEGIAGGDEGPRWPAGRTTRLATRLTVAIATGLIALSAVAYLLPGSSVVRQLMRGVL
jgi:hydrogenase-4 component F